MGGDLLDRTLSSKGANTYTSVLFYASWCPFSHNVHSTFGVLSSMFPQIEHLAVEESSVEPRWSCFLFPFFTDLVILFLYFFNPFSLVWFYKKPLTVSRAMLQYFVCSKRFFGGIFRNLGEEGFIEATHCPLGTMFQLWRFAKLKLFSPLLVKELPFELLSPFW